MAEVTKAEYDSMCDNIKNGKLEAVLKVFNCKKVSNKIAYRILRCCEEVCNNGVSETVKLEQLCELILKCYDSVSDDLEKEIPLYYLHSMFYLLKFISSKVSFIDLFLVYAFFVQLYSNVNESNLLRRKKCLKSESKSLQAEILHNIYIKGV